MTGAEIAAAMGLGLAAVSAWLSINGKDGSGWGFVAFVCIVTSCTRAT